MLLAAAPVPWAPAGIASPMFESHPAFDPVTGEIDLVKLESLLRALADGSLKHEDVFNDMGHGALIYETTPFEFRNDEFDVVVTGPRRSMLQTMDHGPSSIVPYFAAPFGDMMIAG